MEEDLWSKLMIAPLYNNALDGDVQMRQQWLTITNRYSTALHCITPYSSDENKIRGQFYTSYTTHTALL
jgi:hypothetical protein